MKYKESRGNIFAESSDFKFVQCISADLEMSKGIAPQFNKNFNTKEIINSYYPNGKILTKWHNDNSYDRGYCIYIDPVYNLITKDLFFKKPNMITMENSLRQLKKLSLMNEDYKLAMPKIGCGLDQLNWNKVSSLIKKIFSDTDTEIHVWYLKDFIR